MDKQLTRSQFKILSKLEGLENLIYEEGNGDETGYYFKGDRVNAVVAHTLIVYKLVNKQNIKSDFIEYNISDKGKSALRTMQYKV